LSDDKLVPMTDLDLDHVLKWRNAPHVRQNMYSQHKISPDEHRNWWQLVKDRDDRRYYIFERSGIASGFASLSDIDQVNGTASWAFFAAEDAEKGTGTLMEQAVLTKAFSELGLRKLCCEVLDFNSRVVAFHERFGFQVEGRLAEHKLINGHYCDVLLMAIFARDWQGFDGSQIKGDPCS